MKLGGVIYLHNICEARMQEIAKQDVKSYLQEAQEWGTTFILGNTQWGKVDPDVGKQREKALTDELQWCMKVHRFQVDNLSYAAWGLVDAVLHDIKEGRTFIFSSESLSELQHK